MKEKLSLDRLNPLLDLSAGIENAPYLVDSLVNGGRDASTQAYASCGDCGCAACATTDAPGVRHLRSRQGRR